MATRGSQPFALGSAGNVQINTNLQGPSPRQTATEHFKVQTDAGATDAVLNQLFGAAAQVAGKAWDVETQQAYLDGVAASSMGKTMEDLNTPALTKDWSTAGFKDTQTKLRQASAESKFLVDLKQLRTEGDEGKVLEYLRASRTSVLDGSDGMSGAGQRALLEKQLTFEQGAIKSWARARYEYIGEVESSAIQAQATVVFSGLRGALESGNVPEIEAHRAKFLSLATSDIINNPRIDDSQRQSLIKDLADRGMQANDPALYERMASTVLSNGKTILGMLPAKDQIELSAKQNQVLQATESQRMINWGDADGAFTATIQSEHDAPPDRSTYTRHLDIGTNAGSLKLEQRASKWAAYLKAVERWGSKANLDIIYRTGNKEALYQSGKSEEEALKEFVASNAKLGKTEMQTVEDLVKIGTDHGWKTAIKEAGTRVVPLMNAFSNADGTPNAMNTQQFRKFNDMISNLEKDSKSGIVSDIMAGMPDAQRAIFLGMRRAMAEGRSDVDVINSVAERKRMDQTLSPAARAAEAARNGKDTVEMALDFNPMSVMQELNYGIRRFTGIGSTTELAMNPKGFFKDREATESYTSRTRAEFKLSADAVNAEHPSYSKDEAKAAAIADIKGRLLDTDHGPVYLPKGTDARQYFGAPASASMTQIAGALSKLSKPDVKGADSYVYTSGTKVTVVEYKDGRAVNTRTIDADRVGAAITEDNSKKNVQREQHYGAGASVSVGRNAIQFNGDNTATLDAPTMFALRQNIVRNEGVITTVKESRSTEGKPVLTVGAGVSNRNTAWPKGLKAGDNVSQAVINSTFFDASNEAAKIGVNVARATGINSKESVLLFSEMAYQGGGAIGTGKQYLPMIQHMKAGDVEAALKAFASTSVYADSGQTRRLHYRDLIIKAMKG